MGDPVNNSPLVCWFGLVYFLFNVTFNDISVINVTAHRTGGLKKLDLLSGSHAIDIS